MKIALIGACGHQGYALNAMRLMPEATLCAIAKGDESENISTYMNMLKDSVNPPKSYDCWKTMLDKEEPFAVSVSPKYFLHQKISCECLRRGIHVMSEKPVAMNFDELAELEETWRKSGKGFIGMHAMRYHPEFRAAYEAVKSGLIGKPLLINSQKSYSFSMERPEFYKKRELFGGTICWVAIHALDWTYWMMGHFDTIFATHTTEGNWNYGSCESSGVIAFNFRNFGQGTVNFDFLKAHKDTVPRDFCRIAGEKGTIEAFNGHARVITHDEIVRELELKPGENIFKDFLDEVRGKGKCLLSSEDTFEVTRIALAARQSADTGKVLKINDFI
ncbi:MAG: hypothetical protein A2020_02755 [Lentisphaerae bacterium GWF2_45_14]|nr:MAG: hypothetical protein A2020_02755 [Lentisphaerae bacterium GWF2_45_14]